MTKKRKCIIGILSVAICALGAYLVMEGITRHHRLEMVRRLQEEGFPVKEDAYCDDIYEVMDRLLERKETEDLVEELVIRLQSQIQQENPGEDRSLK